MKPAAVAGGWWGHEMCACANASVERLYYQIAISHSTNSSALIGAPSASSACSGSDFWGTFFFFFFFCSQQPCQRFRLTEWLREALSAHLLGDGLRHLRVLREVRLGLPAGRDELDPVVDHCGQLVPEVAVLRSVTRARRLAFFGRLQKRRKDQPAGGTALLTGMLFQKTGSAPSPCAFM